MLNCYYLVFEHIVVLPYLYVIII